MDKLNNIRDMAAAYAQWACRSPRDWMRFLDTASRMYRYRFPEQMLIYAQRPDATACASLDVWNSRVGRWVNRGAKGIALLDDNGAQPRLRYVFDVSDTHAVRNSPYPYIWRVENRHMPHLLAYLADTYSLPDVSSLSRALEQIADQVAEDYLDDAMTGIEEEMPGSSLAELDEAQRRNTFFETMRASLLYATARRCGLDAAALVPESTLTGIQYFDREPVLALLGDTISSLTETILVDIGREIRAFDRENAQIPLAKTEDLVYNGFSTLKRESEQDEDTEERAQGGLQYGTDLSSQRGLPLSESGDRDGRGTDDHEVRLDAEEIPEGEQAALVSEHADDREAGAASGGDRADGAGAGGADRGSAEPDQSPAGQGDEPAGLGGAHEQPDGDGRGDSGERPDLQLTATDEESAPDEDGAMTDAEVEMASALSLPETLSAAAQITDIERGALAESIGEMPFPMEVVDDFLRSGSALKNSVPAIIYNCMQEKTPEERLTRLKQLYPTAGKGLIINGQRYAAAWNENGMEIALGDAAYGNLVKVMLTWEQMDTRVQQLLDGGQFASQETLDSVPEQAYREHAQQLLFLYRDMTHDAQNTLFSGYDITANGRGFDEERDSISAILHNPDDLAAIIQRLGDLNEQEKQGGDIMNTGGYRLNEVASNLPILARPTHFFIAQPDFMPASHPQFITGEQIDRFFTDGGPIAQTRLTLYSYYLNHEDDKERAEYIRQLYGTGGRYPAVRGDDSLSASYSAKGITLTLNGSSQPEDRVDIKWPAAARRIDLLMQSDRYLTPRDYAHMPEFQRDYLAGSVVAFYSNLPDGMTAPFPGTEVYDQLRAVAPMLDDPEQVLTLIESMTDVVAATSEDDEDYGFRRRTLADVSDYTDGIYTLFPQKPTVTHGEQLSMEALFDAMERESLTYQDDGEPPDDAEPESETHNQAQPELAVGMTFTVDGRQFSVEQIATLSRDVTLSDLTFQQTNGYPIFRVEKYETVVDWLVSAEQARQDDLIERLMPNEESLVQDTPEIIESEEPVTEGAAEPDESIIPVAAASVNQERRNFRITDDDLGAGGLKAKFRMNMDAIYLLKTLENENRLATAEEQEVLSRFVGWGGIPQAFDPDNREWAGEYAEVRAALTDEEYRAARGSTLNAFYTSPTVIKAMYEALGNMGLTGGNVLEPSCGVGNFMGLVPDSMDGLRMYGVELDSVTGRIARQLYQRNQIAIQGFEETEFPDSFFDVVIGNVPFGSYKVPDRKYDRYNFLIHDYFLARSIDLLRPGGVMAVVTSSGTMDKQNDSVRRYIAARADLLGAIRLPDNAFLRNANTGVVTDILFLQKRDSLSIDMPEWVHLDTTEDGFTLNAYFVQHPEMILGELSTENTQYASQAMTVRPIDGAVLAEQLKEAISHIHGQIMPLELPDTDLTELPETIPADPNVRNFSYTVIDDTVYFRENSIMTPVTLSPNAAGRVKGMVELRNATQALLDAQLEDGTDEQITALQRDLSERYDRFTAAYGLISGTANRRAFSQDSSYCMLAALEVTDEEGRLVRKADIFTRRTIQRPVPVQSVDTASEALALSMGERAQVDLAYMTRLCSKSEEEIITELRGVIFRNPETGRWETNDEYLSGNVRQKLDIARNAARDDESYAINVEYLQRVQPRDLDASEIEVRLGATWIEPHYLDDFMREVFHTPRWKIGYAIQAQYAEVSGVWNISGKSSDSGNPVTNSTYGTNRVNGYKLLEDALNLKNTKIYDIVRDAEGEHRVLNKQQTILAQQKQDMIRDAFKEWIFKDLARREVLCAKYNRLFNAIRPREYDGSHIRFVGMTPAITLMPHQKNAVAHILYGGNTLLAHCVGAGKTFSMIAAGMESRRLGLSQKNLYVVPNHLTEQWGADFLRLYPGAHILVATKKDFEPANRKKFCSRIATGDYDAVIIGHSQFEKIPLSRARQADMIQRQIDDITDAIETQKSQRSESFTVKQMERTRKGLEARLQRLNDQSRKDDVVTFEQLGVDRLFVDESHNFKNLFLYTKMQNVAGIQQTDAQKSSDMFMKCRYLDSITGGRGIVFATGTPVSNSIVELYTIMRYLQYDLLQRMDMIHFDAWASAFGDTVTAIELAPEGTGYRSKTRFARFYNLPELISMFKEAADVQTADMLKLLVPEAEYVNETLKPSDIQKDMVAGFSERAEKVRSGTVDPRADNMLKITNDGRKCALDQRLVNELHGDYPDSKVNMCVRNTLKVWQEGQEKKVTQLIFCDLSTPKGDGQFNIYDDLREKLTAQGVPREEIAFIHEADTETKKAELFAKVRSGQVRILIGSTPKLGAGTNVQDRLAALHHLDVPWKPSDLEQQEGRILRQGNMNEKVQIFRYVTEGTFDAYMWQLLENKQKFISQIMTSKSPVRACQDVDDAALTYAEIKALATGNPCIKEKMDLDVQVSKLRLLKANFVSQQYQLESQVMRTYPARIAECKERIANMTADLNAARPFLQADKDQFLMQVGKSTYTERKEAGTALIKLCGSAKDARHEIQAGEYHGFRLGINYNLFSNAYELSIHGQGTYTVELGSDPSGNITRINNALSSLENRIKENQTQLLTTQEQLAIARQELQKPFAQEQELADKQARLSELNSMLNMDQKDTDAALLEESASPEEEAPAQEQTEAIDETTEEPVKLKSVVIEL